MKDVQRRTQRKQEEEAIGLMIVFAGASFMAAIAITMLVKALILATTTLLVILTGGVVGALLFRLIFWGLKTGRVLMNRQNILAHQRLLRGRRDESEDGR